MPAKNEKKERFKRVATARTNKIIDMIRLLGNCSNTGNYEYTDVQVAKIFNAIDKELEECKNLYRLNEPKEEKERFTL